MTTASKHFRRLLVAALTSLALMLGAAGTAEAATLTDAVTGKGEAVTISVDTTAQYASRFACSFDSSLNRGTITVHLPAAAKLAGERFKPQLYRSAGRNIWKLYDNSKHWYTSSNALGEGHQWHPDVPPPGWMLTVETVQFKSLIPGQYAVKGLFKNTWRWASLIPSPVAVIVAAVAGGTSGSSSIQSCDIGN